MDRPARDYLRFPRVAKLHSLHGFSFSFWQPLEWHIVSHFDRIGAFFNDQFWRFVIFGYVAHVSPTVRAVWIGQV
jgi:hypothetical protein